LQKRTKANLRYEKKSNENKGASELKDMTKTQVIRVLRVRKMLKTLLILSIIFVYVEDATTYLSLILRKDIVEVGTTVLFINMFGLEFGILLSFLIVFTPALLFYYGALHWLPKREENLTSRRIFRLSFIGLTSLCFGLFPSACNDTLGLLFGYAPLGSLDPLSRYFFSLIIVAIGAVTALIIEGKL